MPKRVITQTSVAENLCQLAGEFKSGDPVQAATIRKEFKDQSKNDLTRVVVYLMEVIGSRDAQFTRLQSDNKDLLEILKLNNIDLGKAHDELDKKETELKATAPVVTEEPAAKSLGSLTTDNVTQTVVP